MIDVGKPFFGFRSITQGAAEQTESNGAIALDDDCFERVSTMGYRAAHPVKIDEIVEAPDGREARAFVHHIHVEEITQSIDHAAVDGGEHPVNSLGKHWITPQLVLTAR